MSANDARAEAEWRWPQWRHLRDSWDAVAMQATFRQGAEWQASRKVEPVDNAGDVLDATVRYAKSWQAEGTEVFGPALMLDLVSMVRDARVELAASRKIEAPVGEREALLQTLRNYGQRPTTAEGIRKGGDAELTDFLIAAGYRKVEVEGPQRAETAMTTGTPERG